MIPPLISQYTCYECTFTASDFNLQVHGSHIYQLRYIWVWSPEHAGVLCVPISLGKLFLPFSTSFLSDLSTNRLRDLANNVFLSAFPREAQTYRQTPSFSPPPQKDTTQQDKAHLVRIRNHSSLKDPEEEEI